MECKFCRVGESGEVDFYCCDSCQSYMCHNCMYTSAKSGKDYCEYCKRNLEREGRKL